MASIEDMQEDYSTSNNMAYDITPVSADEMVIRSRGRRQLPISFSPEKSNNSSPIAIITGSSGTCHRPAKSNDNQDCQIDPLSVEQVKRRLNFEDELFVNKLPVISKVNQDGEGIQMHPSEIEFLDSQKSKKQRIIPSEVSGDSPTAPDPFKLASGLSKSQLVKLLASLTQGNPDLMRKLKYSMPKPDLTCRVSRLSSLFDNIFRALPRSRFSNKLDSMAYNRVATHLAAFKKSVLEDCDLLMEACQWESVLEYVIRSWEYVGHTPTWDNVSHNNYKNSCFKHLAGAVVQVLNRKDFLMKEEVKIELLALMASSGNMLRETQVCRELLSKM